MASYFKKHKHGILGTLLFHMFLLIVFLAIEIKTKKQHFSSELVFDFEQVDVMEEIRKEKEKEIQELLAQTDLSSQEMQNLNNDLQSNRAVNESVDELNDNLRDDRNSSDDELYEMAKRLQEQLDKTNQEFQKLDDFGALDEEIDTLTKPIQTSFYKGPTNITFELKNRLMAKLEVPVYKCQGGGSVKVKILVNRNGYVVKTTIDIANSVLDECFLEAATNAAMVTRFNKSVTAPENQEGSITYNFVAQ